MVATPSEGDPGKRGKGASILYLEIQRTKGNIFNFKSVEIPQTQR